MQGCFVWIFISMHDNLRFIPDERRARVGKRKSCYLKREHDNRMSHRTDEAKVNKCEAQRLDDVVPSTALHCLTSGKPFSNLKRTSVKFRMAIPLVVHWTSTPHALITVIGPNTFVRCHITRMGARSTCLLFMIAQQKLRLPPKSLQKPQESASALANVHLSPPFIWYFLMF